MSVQVPRCWTCNAVFDSVEAVRKHYESEYHTNNVRLRVDGRRPLTTQEYRRVRIAEHDDADVDGRPTFACKLCKKTFHSVQTLQAHVRSTAHLMKKEQRIIARDSDAMSALTSTSLGSAAMGLHRRHNAKRAKPPTQAAKTRYVEKVQLDEREEDVSEVRCLFCGCLSDSVEVNLQHMNDIHEFSVPLPHRCRDVVGLLAYLARKMNGLLCLVCGEKTRAFASLEALRAHMREKNHERIILGPEYAEFYSVSLADTDCGARIGPNDTELVLRDSQRVVQRRECEVPRPRKKESETQAEKRRAILAADQEAMAMARKERQEVLRVQNKEAQKILKRQDGQYQDHLLRVNLRTNKLHPKGYDGEGKLN
ncbi:zinc finger protein, conserved [Trypanosoma conorhini]|uniref:Zinc finger protein, conserved n=1 Tax=Trypanosoma conorhini TaxID=83891 RepID=A0A3R7NSJ3_9TRYP|nr:zinc finger protein, conserved [Trypanosoma conorhini]RNF26404.1 zinc finger protein, conserved [Trypanosoma conorhini]